MSVKIEPNYDIAVKRGENYILDGELTHNEAEELLNQLRRALYGDTQPTGPVITSGFLQRPDDPPDTVKWEQTSFGFTEPVKPKAEQMFRGCGTHSEQEQTLCAEKKRTCPKCGQVTWRGFDLNYGYTDFCDCGWKACPEQDPQKESQQRWLRGRWVSTQEATPRFSGWFLVIYQGDYDIAMWNCPVQQWRFTLAAAQRSDVSHWWEGELPLRPKE